MTFHTLPGIGIQGGGTAGDPWTTQGNGNFLALSTLTKLVVSQLGTTLPGSPSQGTVVLLSAAAGSNPTCVAVYDTSAWTYYTPTKGWGAYNTATSAKLIFNGTDWVTDTDASRLATSGGTGTATVLSGGTISGATISGGTAYSLIQSGGVISGGTLLNEIMSGGTTSGVIISGGVISGATVSGGSLISVNGSGGTATNEIMSGGTVISAIVSGGTISGAIVSGGTFLNIVSASIAGSLTVTGVESAQYISLTGSLSSLPASSNNYSVGWNYTGSHAEVAFFNGYPGPSINNTGFMFYQYTASTPTASRIAYLDGVGNFSTSGAIQPAVYTLATLPSASSLNEYIITVSNATGGQKVCQSNGTNWLILNTSTTVF